MLLQALACRFGLRVQLRRLLDGDAQRHGIPVVDFAALRPAASLATRQRRLRATP
jgi:hypothetical protein